MGTTLTGTTPQDTYDSLIKVTDNGPLSGTAKYLSDGLGNDSALALSTAAVGIGTNNPVSELQVGKASDVVIAMSNSSSVTSGNRGTLAFYNSATSTVAMVRAAAVSDNVGTELQFHTRPAAGSLAQTMTITSAGNVGIGTSSPQSTLDVRKLSTNLGTTSELGLLISNTGISGQYAQIGFGYSESTCAAVIAGVITNPSGATTSNLVFATRSGTSGATAPVERVRVTENGLTFNGDTAAANALDDYEEGTWTPASNTSGYTISSSSGSYTKIGRQVTLRGVVAFSAVNALSTSVFIFIGLPFTPNDSYQGSCREDTSTGAMFMTAVRAASDGILNSMDGISSGSQQEFTTSRAYRFTVTYFV